MIQISNKKKRKHELELLEKFRDSLNDVNEESRNIYINGILTDYVVTNFGRIYSLKKGKIKELKPIRLPNEYYVVTLYIGDIKTRQYIHRLVGRAFLEIPDKYKDIGLVPDELEINHINGKEKWNNTIFNIEWSTGSDNKYHSYRTGLRPVGEDNFLSKYTEAQIIKVCELLVADKLSPKNISKITAVSVGMIHDIKNHGSWHHITDKYDFSHCRDKQKKYSDEAINHMHRLFKKGIYSCKEISNKTGIPISSIYYYKEKYYNDKGI